MNLSSAFACSSLLLGLIACGNDSHSQPMPVPAPAASAQATEFDGAWIPEPTRNPCLDGFPFSEEPHHYRLRGIELQSEAGGMSAAVAFDIFNDGACTNLVGVASERFHWATEPNGVPGHDQAIRATPTWLGASLSGGNAGPRWVGPAPSAEHTIAGWAGLHLTADVQGQQLLLAFSHSGQAQDARGFPLGFDSQPVFIRP